MESKLVLLSAAQASKSRDKLLSNKWPAPVLLSVASQVALVVKSLPANARDMRQGFDPWVGKMPWRRAWQRAPVFLPGESLGQRGRVVGCSP